MAEYRHAAAPSEGARMMLEPPGRNETADRVVRGLGGALAAGAVTRNCGRRTEAMPVKTWGLAEAIVDDTG